MEEDKIIKEGLKTHTKSDIICYIGMALLFIMIFIPPVFRVVFYDAEANAPKPKVVLLNLKCRRAMYRESFRLVSNVDANYVDSVPQTVVIDFTYEKEGGITDISEVNELLGVNSEGVKVEQIKDGYRFTLDYANYPLNQIEELKKYGYLAPPQMQMYDSMNYYCESTTETIEKDD